MIYSVSEEEWRNRYEKLKGWRANTVRKESDKGLGTAIYKKIIDSLNISKGSTLLDLGCGSCGLRPLLPEGVIYFGIDPFPVIPEDQRSALGFRMGEAENIPFPDGYFDIVICFASIFHFRNLNQSFLETKRILKEGGRFLLLTVMNKELSESHTFRITHELLDELGKFSKLDFVGKREVEEIKSWLYEWKK